jgi:hypothetical protein
MLKGYRTRLSDFFRFLLRKNEKYKEVNLASTGIGAKLDAGLFEFGTGLPVVVVSNQAPQCRQKGLGSLEVVQRLQ